MSFPTLKKSPRDREYKSYSPQKRAEVICEYLFHRRSHRWLDANILDQDSEVSRGWQSMGILHHLGLVKTHQAYFRDCSVEEAIDTLEMEDSIAYEEIVKYLRFGSSAKK